ncbi:MAG: hypothetical protein AAFY88_20745, partial [Acidobacteriota bacterium]
RSAEGEALLQEVHDLFYALLFCSPAQGVRLQVPAAGVSVTASMKRSSRAALPDGTWLDPEGISDDIGARNTLLQVEFGDSSDGLISDGLIVIIRLINFLEINEEILYARIEQLEKSTLVT